MLVMGNQIMLVMGNQIMLVMRNQSMLVMTQEHRFFKIYPIIWQSMLVTTQEHRFFFFIYPIIAIAHFLWKNLTHFL